MRIRMYLSYAACFLAVCIIFGPGLKAQSVNGTISGIVTDPQGAAVADATVTLTSQERNIVVRTLQTNSEGHYVAAALPVGK